MGLGFIGAGVGEDEGWSMIREDSNVAERDLPKREGNATQAVERELHGRSNFFCSSQLLVLVAPSNSCYCWVLVSFKWLFWM